MITIFGLERWISRKCRIKNKIMVVSLEIKSNIFIAHLQFWLENILLLMWWFQEHKWFLQIDNFAHQFSLVIILFFLFFFLKKRQKRLLCFLANKQGLLVTKVLFLLISFLFLFSPFLLKWLTGGCIKPLLSCFPFKKLKISPRFDWQPL